MDTHKPRPFHGWGEFAKEVGIIVLGVLIALGGEQTAEALRWRHEVAEARKSLDRQAAEQLFAASERAGLEACEARQLDRMSEILIRRGPTPRIWRKVTPHFRGWNTSTWGAATASGAVAHLPADIREAYADHFGIVESMSALNQQEFIEASDLAGLEAPTELSDTARDRLTSDVARLKGLNRMLAIGSRQIVGQLHQLGVEMDSKSVAALKRELGAPCLMPDDAPA